MSTNKRYSQKLDGVDEALKHYADAMSRIAQVEARIEELAKRLDAVKVLATASEVDTSTPVSDDDGTSSDSSELEHLRKQMSTITTSLAEREEELLKYTGSKRVRSYRGATPWWKKLGRPLGINKRKRKY